MRNVSYRELKGPELLDNFASSWTFLDGEVELFEDLAVLDAGRAKHKGIGIDMRSLQPIECITRYRFYLRRCPFAARLDFGSGTGASHPDAVLIGAAGDWWARTGSRVDSGGEKFASSHGMYELELLAWQARLSRGLMFFDEVETAGKYTLMARTTPDTARVAPAAVILGADVLEVKVHTSSGMLSTFTALIDGSVARRVSIFDVRVNPEVDPAKFLAADCAGGLI